MFQRKTRKFKLRSSLGSPAADDSIKNKERFQLKSTRKSQGFSLTWLIIAFVLLLIGIYILDVL